MARRRPTARSSTERRVVGDLAFRELLNRALPLLTPDDCRIVDLLQSGSTTDEVAVLMNMPHKAGVEARIAHAQGEVARACRTVAATASLLEEERSLCQEFASYATLRRRLFERRKRIQAKLAEASGNYQRFTLVRDTGLPGVYMEDNLWSRAKFLTAKGKAKETYDIAQTEAAKLPDLERKMEDIVSRATEHAASCTDCQQEVIRILGQNWSPF
jgi:hypothetical protein